MKRLWKRLFAFALTAAMVLSLLPVAAFAARAEDDAVAIAAPGADLDEAKPAGAADTVDVPAVLAEATNLALNKTVYVSGSEIEHGTTNGSGVNTDAENAVDGDRDSRWSGNLMKGVTGATNGSNPSWIVVDLTGANACVASITSISIEYFAKVWGCDYVVQVAGNNYTPADFVSNVGVVAASDAAFSGQHAKDAACWTTIKTYSGKTNADHPTDTISASEFETSIPEGTRYLRLYFTKMNDNAGGGAIGLEELTVMGTTKAVESVNGAWNLAQGQPVAASSQDSSSTANKAVDGNTSTTQWSSGDMKEGEENADPNAEQTHQWLWVDLGATGSQIDHIKLYYNMKVWPMVYEIQTADDVNGAWETVVRVERSPFAGAVKNGAGQNIADETGNDSPSTAANTDTITTTSVPSLQMTTLKRYVRVYIEKVNTSAPGNNTGIRELEIYGVNENRHPAVDVAALLAGVTNGTVSVDGAGVNLPSAPSGAAIEVVGSSLENVVTNSGIISQKNIGAREVTLLVRASDLEDPDNYAEKNLTVTVPDHKSTYGGNWFPNVSSPNPKPEVIPAIQEWYGYTGSFQLSTSSRIVINDAAHVGLQKVAENMQGDLQEISGLDLPIVTGTSGGANDIYIESQTADNYYDLGDEGYLMRVSDEGIKIYAPTYTGCIFGTITVEQILWQAADHLSVPKGIMRDYPAYEVRGLKLDIGRAPTRYQQLQDYAKIMLWYKMSEFDLHINDTENVSTLGAAKAGEAEDLVGFHRLESDTFPSLKLMDGVKRAGVNASLVDADYYNAANGYGGNPVYTKQQWKDLTQLAKDYGMHLLTEIDMPGHALAYNNYVEAYPAEAAAAGVTGPIRSTDTSDYRASELLELTGDNAENALNFAKALWDEYTADGTISGDVVHIGADEYWVHNTATHNAFVTFADELRKVIQKNLGSDTKIRMWGATSSSFAPATTVLNKTHKELAEDYELEIWSTGYDDPVARSKDGYKIVNCEQSAMYSCPGRHQRDVPNAEYVFNSWDPTVFGGSQLLYGDPNLLGAKAVMWGEQTQEGLTERDVHQRVLRAIAIVSEKTWSGKQQSEGTFSNYEMRAARLAEGPGTQIAMKVDSETSLVLDYDFKNLSTSGTTVYDQSGNGYNGTLNAAGTVDADGYLTFNGSTLLTTDITTLSYPYTVSFDLKAGAGNTAASSLFSGYDGRIQIAGHNNHLSANACSFIRDFEYTVPTDGTAVNITIVGTFQATRLYVNGQLVKFLSQTGDSFQDGVASGAITSYFSSVPLPLEEIGKGLHGAMANLKVYNKAMSADEVAAVYAGTDDALVNVAQNAVAGGSSYQSGDGYDGTGNANQRTGIAAKAVDGEEEEMYSFWKADHSDSALTVDLGQTRSISQVVTKWSGTAPSSTIQTSANGTTWKNFTNGTAVSARYVKVNANGAGSLKELMVYEQVDKTDLSDMLEQAEALVESKSAGFESTGEDAELFEAVVFARAVQNSPLATKADVAKAMEGLEPYADGPEPSAFTVTVPDEDITLIAAKANWTAVEGATGYTVTITSEEHTGLNDDNVWYQNDDARTVKLANLHPGVEYTVTVSGGGKTASATFTTKISTNAKAEAAKLDPEAPAAYGALPDDNQLYYHDRDLAAFIHFSVNTYTGRSWGTGWETPSTFNLQAGELTDDPYYAQRECGQIPVFVDQWVKELQDAGFQRLIMVGKHHDGFCLWDSKVTSHNVMNSPYGRDLMADVSAACSKYGMDMGFYLSPWDQNAESFGYWTEKDRTKRTADNLLSYATKDQDVSGDYNAFYVSQLREVLGNDKYGRDGEFVETWMDGAKGVFFQYQAGSIVGTNTNLAVDQEYDFDAYFKVIRELQPKCLIYSDRADGGVRWSGNEVGSTGANAAGTDEGDMCWQTMDVGTQNYEGTDTPGMMIPWKKPKWNRQRGQENGVIWAVCECDVSIETEWFWHAGNGVRALKDLVNMYLSASGYSSPLLLNMPPNQNGRYDEDASQRLAELGKAIRDTFSTDLASGKAVTASATRTSSSGTKFAPANLTDDNDDNYWTMNDGQTTGWVEVDLGSSQVFDVVTIKEYIALGQRIKAGTVEYHDEGGWHEFATFTTVGAKRIMRSAPVLGDKVRVTITGSNAVPLLSAVEVYKARSGMEQTDSIPAGMVYIDDRDASFTYVGSWQEQPSEGYENTRKGGSGENNSVSGTFSGSMFYLIGIMDTAHGHVKIEIDAGTDHAITETVNTYAGSRQKKAIMYTSPALSNGPHTVKFSRVDGWFEFDGIFYLPDDKGMVEFEQASYDVFPNSDLTLKIIRSGNTSSAIEIKVNDLPGTAVQGQHYEPVQKMVTFAAGQTEATVTFHTLNGSPGNEAAGKDYSAAIMECSDPNTTLGLKATAVINILDPDTVPQEPQGETYTAQDPFNFPAQVGKTRKLEAEHMVLDGSEAASGKHVRVQPDADASGGKKLGWFEPNNKVLLHYNAPVAGEYTVTMCYQSGRDSSNPNHINWRGDKVVDSAGTDVVGQSSNGSVYETMEMRLTVTEAGAGTLEFYADASAGPNMDYFTFRLDAAALTGVTVSGTAKAGQKLTAKVTPDGATATYQWYRVEDGEETAISGATGSQYTLTDEDVGKTVFVKATGTGSSCGAVFSAPTATVTEAPAPFNPPSGSSTSDTPEDEGREDGATVSVAYNPDGSVTETVEQTDGTTAETVTARNGDKVITVTDPDGEELAKVELPAKLPVSETEFTDVPTDHWAKESINKMKGLGLVNGVGGGLYDTGAPVTRGALATVLHRLSNGKTDYRVTFADVRANKYYTQGVAWAARAKVVTGYTADIFAPDDTITREQLAVMMVRYAKLIGMDTTAKAESLEAFVDGDTTGAWAVNGMAWCVENGILKGKGLNNLDPTADVSRAEVAVMLDRFIALIQK